MGKSEVILDAPMMKRLIQCILSGGVLKIRKDKLTMMSLALEQAITLSLWLSMSELKTMASPGT